MSGSGQENSQSGSGHTFPNADEIVRAIRETWEKGNASRLDTAKDGRNVFSVSLVVGAIGFVLVPVAALIGIGAALITEYTIKITLDDGTVINVNEFAITRKQTKTARAEADNPGAPEARDARDVTPDAEQA